MRSASFSFFASQRALALVAPCSDRANTDEPRALRLDEGIGMDGDEQVGMRLARLFHAHAERDEVIAVANEDGAHVGRVVDLCFQPARDGERHIFFVRAAPSASAGIFAAVSGIHGDEQYAVAEFGACQRFGGRLGRQGNGRLCWCFRDRDWTRRGGFACGEFGLALLRERHQRVDGNQRINVQNQTIAIFGDRLAG